MWSAKLLRFESIFNGTIINHLDKLVAGEFDADCEEVGEFHNHLLPGSALELYVSAFDALERAVEYPDPRPGTEVHILETMNLRIAVVLGRYAHEVFHFLVTHKQRFVVHAVAEIVVEPGRYPLAFNQFSQPVLRRMDENIVFHKTDLALDLPAVLSDDCLAVWLEPFNLQSVQRRTDLRRTHAVAAQHIPFLVRVVVPVRFH